MFNFKRLIMLFGLITYVSCIDYKNEMINFVIDISKRAKSLNKNFNVIPNIEPSLIGTCSALINSVDGVLRVLIYINYNYDY